MLYCLSALVGVVRAGGAIDMQGQVFRNDFVDYGEAPVCSSGY